MARFYVDGLSDIEKSISIYGDDVNHIRNVLRLKEGDKIIVNNNNGIDYTCVISSTDSSKVIADVVDVNKNSSELDTRIVLFQGMPKSDKMEFIIQKAVELGVAEIVPVMTRRTVVKIDAKKETKKIDRYNAISESAAKQSGRGVIPVVKNFMSYSEAIEYAKTLSMNIIPYEEASGIEESRQIVSRIKGKDSLGIFIGPEGGFAKEEVEKARGIGAHVVTLGNRILRTETAGLATLAIIMFEIQ